MPSHRSTDRRRTCLGRRLVRPAVGRRAAVWLALLGGAALAACGPAPGPPPDASELVSIEAPEPGSVELRGFVLDHGQRVHITAVSFESRPESPTPAELWIADAAGEPVWEIAAAEPSRRRRYLSEFEVELELAPGVYELGFAVASVLGDNGGSAGRVLRDITGVAGFVDAAGGLEATVYGDGRALDAVELERRRTAGLGEPLVDLGGLGDGVFEVRGFTLERPATVEIRAAGELSRSSDRDVGWIVDAVSREPVWSLDRDGSRPGGGSDRNRAERRRLELPAGRYAAYFVTDGSHSAGGGWQATPPRDPGAWGLRVWCVGAATGGGDEEAAAADPCAGARPVEPGHLPTDRILAEITGVGDDAEERAELTVGPSGAVWVYALGEGDTDRLYDRGWIEDAAGERVWEMPPERSHPAGGAGKNRLVDELVHLAPGRYSVVYASDGSHSAGGGWNAPPPAQPERWGITVMAADG